MSAPTRLVTCLSSRVMDLQALPRGSLCREIAFSANLPGRALGAPRKGSRAGGRSPLLMLGPALDQLIIGDRLALWLFIGELGPWSMLGAQPLRGIALGVKPGTAAVIGFALLVGRLHAGHEI